MTLIKDGRRNVPKPHRRYARTCILIVGGIPLLMQDDIPKIDRTIELASSNRRFSHCFLIIYCSNLFVTLVLLVIEFAVSRDETNIL
jgi:hypothetical protein